jgi:hypothetical protein
LPGLSLGIQSRVRTLAIPAQVKVRRDVFTAFGALPVIVEEGVHQDLLGTNSITGADEKLYDRETSSERVASQDGDSNSMKAKKTSDVGRDQFTSCALDDHQF